MGPYLEVTLKMQVAESFIEEAGLNDGEEGACEEDIEVPYFVLFCPN